MFEGFKTFDVVCNNVTIHGVTGGAGPPLLLLHGYPQTHVMWHKVAPQLSQHFTVVAADLRGYGQSSKPASVADHSSYAKRAMAQDMVELMTSLGHTRFGLAGHDRGARVAHRLALDHHERVTRLAVLDIAPTREMYSHTTDAFARAYWHWFFLIQKAPFPEDMILANTDSFWLKKCGSGSAGLAPFTTDALNTYLAAFRNPNAIRASCEDYRAAASIDIEHDNRDGGRKVECPVLALWGKHGVIERCFDCLALWKLRANLVSGEALPGGHYLAEELPDLVAERLIAFFNV
jgi:haloacetate dehalogenase